MTIILVSGVFVLLSASLDLGVLRRFEWRFGLFLVALLLVVRPLTVFISLAFSRVPWRERLFVGWIAPRGIVAVAISGLFALRLGEIGYGDGSVLVTLSFAVVAATIVAHGFSIGPVAKALGLTATGTKGLLIVGATGWSLGLARALRTIGVPVTVGDTSWQRLAPARAEDIPSYHGEVLSEAREEGIDLHRFAALAATTESEAYNALVCSELAPELGRDNVYQLGDAGGDDPAALPASLRGRAVFRSGLGVEEVAARDEAGWTFGALEVGEMGVASTIAALPDDGGPLLLVRRGGGLRFFTHASNPSPSVGDTILAYAPARMLADAGWRLLNRSMEEPAA